VQNLVVKERQRFVVRPEQSEHVARVYITLCKRGSHVSQNQFEIRGKSAVYVPVSSLRYMTWRKKRNSCIPKAV
jgi:hypothetical protein